MNEQHAMQDQAERRAQERRDFRTYAWGLGLALVTTVVPFAVVHAAPGFSHATVLWVIAVAALSQMLVHFRCFLHIGLRQKREDLLLILFSGLLLTIMMAGTLWIMGSLAGRMALPGQPS